MSISKRIKFVDGEAIWVDCKMKAKNGYPAGSANSAGYRTITFYLKGDMKLLYLHRVHWFMVYGYIPKEIDHIDQDKSNNKIDNLRLATRSQNQRNATKRKNCSSKYVGVCWSKRKKKWVSHIQINGKLISLGCYKSEEDSAIAYNNAVIKYELEEFTVMNNICDIDHSS